MIKFNKEQFEADFQRSANLAKKKFDDLLEKEQAFFKEKGHTYPGECGLGFVVIKSDGRTPFGKWMKKKFGARDYFYGGHTISPSDMTPELLSLTQTASIKVAWCKEFKIWIKHYLDIESRVVEYLT